MAESAIKFNVDPTNPGQFFACCGLLELADRLWKGAEGWFDREECAFYIRAILHHGQCAQAQLIEEIARCQLMSTMTPEQIQRREELSKMTKKQANDGTLIEQEKKEIDKLWRAAPIDLLEPFELRLDWFTDKMSGGSTFKTWAGQQSVLEIAKSMKESIKIDELLAIPPREWLFRSISDIGPSFNFDSNLGDTGSDRDIGFSFDPIHMKMRIRPLVEFAAFVGLQRFRPMESIEVRHMKSAEERRYQYRLWCEPLLPEVASAAACGLMQCPGFRIFEFRLLYRTKYLKSFLPANFIGGDLWKKN